MINKQRTNRDIRAYKVNLISSTGDNMGIMPIRQALLIAQSTGLDLVEVNPNTNPPICKLMDYGKFQYDKKKALKNQTKPKDTKGIKITPQMEQHDLEVRYRRAIDFLTAGHDVRLTVELKRGYQRKVDEGHEVANKFIDSLLEAKAGSSDRKFSQVKRGFAYVIKSNSC